MGKKKTTKLTGRVLYQSDPNFDWSVYDNGYTGGSTLCVNPNVKTNKKDKVYCHEPYAQELYDIMESHFAGRPFAAKDVAKGASYVITNVSAVSDHEINVDTNAGMSIVIDLDKEHQYLDYLGCSSPELFTSAVRKSDDFKKAFLKSGITAKVMATGRISLWEGVRARIESEFMEQIRNSSAKPYAYKAKVLEVVKGGYIVAVLGIKCFLPGSLASNGVITDFESLVGTTLLVMPVNFVQDKFVVSHKKYLEYIMPELVAEQLYVGKDVSTKVTGFSSNGIFVTFKDKDGNWVFSGLCHRSRMSKEFEKEFDRGYFAVNDQIKMFVHEIATTDKGTIRIILGDSAPKVENLSTETIDTSDL